MNRYTYKVINNQEVLVSVFANSEEEARALVENGDFEDEEVKSDDYLVGEATLEEVEEDV